MGLEAILKTGLWFSLPKVRRSIVALTGQNSTKSLDSGKSKKSKNFKMNAKS